MHNKPVVLYKTLVVGILILLIGVGVYPTFAINIKSSSDSLSAISEKDNPTTAYQEIYENSACLVFGKAREIRKFPSGPFSKIISFGSRDYDAGGYYASKGWINTIGLQGKWAYKGLFFGGFEEKHLLEPWNPRGIGRYVGIKGFRGLALGGSIFLCEFFDCIFIGYAEKVRITTEIP